MLDQTQYSLISQFLYSYSLKIGVHFWFYREILKVI